MQKEFNIVVANIISITLIFCVPLPLQAELSSTQPVITSSAVSATTAQNPPVVEQQAASPAENDFLLQANVLNAVAEPCVTAMCGITNGQIVSGIIFVQPNLTLNPNVRKVGYYINGTFSTREYVVPFTWGGAAGFNTTNLLDGNYTLGGAYTTNAGDQNFSISFTVRNTGTIDTTAPVISAVTSTNLTSAGATINWTTNEVSDSQVEYRVQGAATWTATSVNATLLTNHSLAITGLAANTIYQYQVKSKDAAGNLATQAAIAIFTTLNSPDTTAPVISVVTSTNITASGATINWTTNEASDSQVEYRVQGAATWTATSVNATLLTNHSLAITGLAANTIYQYQVKSKDQAGNLATQATPSNFATAIVVPPAADIVGVTAGGTVSGVVNIGPNLTLYPSVRKIAYYLNGTQSGKYYSTPFTWGGPGGFDTRTLADGVYTLAGVFTTAIGDKPFSVTFTINNTVPPVLAGLTNGQTVRGILNVSLSPSGGQNVQRIDYFLDNVLINAPTVSPFRFGSNTGFDTATITNGGHVLSGQIITPLGPTNFSIPFTVSNIVTPVTPVLTIASPANNVVLPAGTVEIDFDVQNFTIGGLGQPHVRFYIDSDPEPYEFYNGSVEEVWYLGGHTHFTHWHDSSSIEVFAFADGPHQIRFVAVDGNGVAFTNPEATQVVTLTIQASTATGFSLQPVATGVEFPASMIFDPSGRLFYNELLSGKIRIMDPGFVLRPDPFYQFNILTGTDRGLLGIELDPDFQNNHFVYVYYSDVDNTNKVVRLTEVNGIGTNLTVLLGALPSHPGHNGGNIHFGPDGKLYVSIGDMEDSTASQDLGSYKGKILRVNKDGTIPSDNPFVGQVGARSEIWVYGLRNSFDFTFHPITGDLWATENGPDEKDEVNRIVRGGNYGWPNAMGIVGNPNYIDPLIQISPTVGPTGIVVIRADSPYDATYHGRIFFAEFNTGKIKSITLTGPNHDQLGAVETIYDGGRGGLLDLMVGPDGLIYAAGISGIFRVEPGSGAGDPNAEILGVTDGATVSGIVRIYPNISLHAHVYKIGYYLNGTQAGRYYELPFMWGGANGFDTRTLANGTYTLAGVFTSKADGDTPFSVTFTVAN